MKNSFKNFLSLVLFVPLLFQGSCYEDPARNNPNDPYNWKYEFPEFNSSGVENLLYEQLKSFSTGRSYSLNSFVKGNYSLQIIIRNSIQAGFNMDWKSLRGWLPPISYNNPVSNENWTMFFSYSEGINNCEIFFTSPADNVSIEINVINNDSVIMTKTKNIKWN